MDGVDGCSPLLSLFPGEIIMGILSLKCQRLRNHRSLEIIRLSLIFLIIYIYLFFKIALDFKTSFDFIIVFVIDATRRRFFKDETSFFREVIRSLSVWSLSFFFFLFIFVIDTVSFENAGRICRVFTRKGGTFS